VFDENAKRLRGWQSDHFLSDFFSVDFASPLHQDLTDFLVQVFGIEQQPVHVEGYRSYRYRWFHGWITCRLL
jgi:hypothetical protein